MTEDNKYSKPITNIKKEWPKDGISLKIYSSEEEIPERFKTVMELKKQKLEREK